MNKSQKSKNDKYKTDSSDKIDRTSIRIGKNLRVQSKYITTGTTIRLKPYHYLMVEYHIIPRSFRAFHQMCYSFQQKSSGKPHLPKKGRSDQLRPNMTPCAKGIGYRHQSPTKPALLSTILASLFPSSRRVRPFYFKHSR